MTKIVNGSNLPNGSSVAGSSVAGGLTAVICAKKALGMGIGAVVSLITFSPLAAVGLAVGAVTFAFFAKEAVVVAKKMASGEGEKSFVQFFKEYATSIMKTVKNVFEAISNKVKPLFNRSKEEIVDNLPDLSNVKNKVVNGFITAVEGLQSNLYPKAEEYGYNGISDSLYNETFVNNQN